MLLERIIVDADLIELAKSDIREAMRRESLRNLQVIDGQVVSRRTPRYIKEMVFYAMARNNAIAHFLNVSDPSPKELHDNVPIKEEYWKLMHKIGATKYPLEIKRKAEWGLFHDYTQLDYKRQRHFLDSPLPEKPKRNQLFEYVANIVGLIIITSFRFWWVILIAFIGWGIYTAEYNDPVSYSSSSSGHNNTFNSGGVSRGNSASKSSSNSPQIQDASGQSEFGNGGVSGHDAPSSPVLYETRSVQTQSIRGSDNVPDEESSTADKEQSFEKQSSSKEKKFPVVSPVQISEDEQFDVIEGYLTLGSTKEEVLTIMGEPDNKSNFSYGYGFSEIYFDEDKISGWSLIDQELKVSLGEKKEGAPPFTLGSSKKQVIEAMGTPSSVNDHTFSYSFSTINFGTNGKVTGWSEIDEQLNVELGVTIEGAKPFNIGSTVDEVIAIMGTPDSYSDNSLGYEYSSVLVQNGRVTGYSDISQNLIVTE
jgi:cytoskeletal protein RodZ